jgi:hypothetical protein
MRYERNTEMKRTITTMALAAAMLLTAAPAAFATHVDDTKDHGFDESQDTAGALDPGETGECRPGAEDNVLVGSWTLTTKGEYIADVTAVLTQRFEAGYYGDLTEAEFQLRLDGIPERADATWTFCDKNRDGNLCVMTTEVSPYHWTLLDNRPFPA